MNKRVQPKYLGEIVSFWSQGENQGPHGVEVKACVQSQLIHLLTVWPWTCSLTSLWLTICQRGLLILKSYHENIKRYTGLNKGLFPLSSQFIPVIFIRKDIATHQHSFSGTSVTHYSPVAVWGGSFYAINRLLMKILLRPSMVFSMRMEFPLVMTDATRPQEQEAAARMDRLTNLGFLLLSSPPVTHLLPQETSPTSTFLTAGDLAQGVHSLIKPSKITQNKGNNPQFKDLRMLPS